MGPRSMLQGFFKLIDELFKLATGSPELGPLSKILLTKNHSSVIDNKSNTNTEN